jgi:uncharacterized protein YndB with AHSA1/START domain
MEKVKVQLEIVVNSSPGLLYNYISNPSGLSEWFAKNVNSRDEKFTFFWDDSEEVAYLKKIKQDSYIRFQWEEDADTEYYFEICIQVDDLTKDVSLIITDFAEEDEIEETKLLWENQINDLKKVIGS